VPLTETISALEADLQQLGLDVAANCYRQAVDAIVDQRYESANAQMRALFEEVAIQAAVARGFARTRQAREAKRSASSSASGTCWPMTAVSSFRVCGR
jgi:collagenase-like PrtC family protease